MEPTTQQPILALGGTGKSGRRVAQRLRALGRPVRIGTPASTPSFDWSDPATWPAALDGVGSVYLAYYPDLAVPGAVEAVRSFAELAVRGGAPRLALLSGRGEPEAERAERVVRDTGAELTVLRSTWFMQNFSEDYMLAHVLGGELRLPAGEVATPFVDADDIADVAVAALTEAGHARQVYELTSPRLLTFADAVGEIARAANREIRYVPVSPDDYATAIAEQGLPADTVELLTYLFSEVLGNNAYLTNGVERALGRPPRDFAD
ncbi:MAG TPA: NmrA family transcriptional regulator, partial [Actinomycetota bacterium]|nr:NmrA family transcriptional regulator [Actinomycetota bacterium]